MAPLSCVSTLPYRNLPGTLLYIPKLGAGVKGWGRTLGTYSKLKGHLAPQRSQREALKVFMRPEEEEPRAQICTGAERGYGLSTTVSLGLDPRRGWGR